MQEMLEPPGNSPSKLSYRPDIDGLRAVAVSAVVLFHAFPGFWPGGFVGVDIFFVISGYLISSIIFEGLDRGTFSLRFFYERRVRRIFPALIIVLACSLIFGWFVLLPYEYEQLGLHVAAGAGFASNLVLWSEIGYFDSEANTKPLLHLWSLGIEEQFYLLWPLLSIFLWRYSSRRRMVSIILLFLASLTSNVLLVKHYPEASFYCPFTRFWELLAGSLLTLATRPEPSRRNAMLQFAQRWSGVASFVGFSMIIFALDLPQGKFCLSWLVGNPARPGYHACRTRWASGPAQRIGT